jgi:peptidoglycan/xylan/chitin deacetylase (PgdA/CDA1 family)
MRATKTLASPGGPRGAPRPTSDDVGPPSITLRTRARGRVKHPAIASLAAARVDRICARIRAGRDHVLILNLHRVTPDANAFWPPLTPEAFRNLASFVRRSCDCMLLGDLATARPRGRPLVVLSFDDGFRDFVEYVMPILDEFGLPANQNVIGSAVDSGRPPFAVAVSDALNAAGDKRVSELRIPGFDARLGPGIVGRLRFGIQLANYLKGIPPAAREHVWDPIADLLAEVSERTPMMTKADVSEADAAGHHIGCHSYAHESMEFLTHDAVEHDLDLCDDFFRTQGLKTDVFALPNGSYRTEQIEQLQRRGYRHVLTIGRPGKARAGIQPRSAIYGDSAAELRLRAVIGR